MWTASSKASAPIASLVFSRPRLLLLKNELASMAKTGSPSASQRLCFSSCGPPTKTKFSSSFPLPLLFHLRSVSTKASVPRPRPTNPPNAPTIPALKPLYVSNPASCFLTLTTCTQVEWVEGVAITVAILIVVLVGSLNDYQKERQFRKLNAQKEERNVKVIRDGSEKLMSVYDVLVGDVLIIEPGEIIPVDGVMISGHNVRCDESGATGESDAVKKVPMEELGKEDNKKADPFLLSGAKVLEGVGSYVVTGVGEASFHGRIMMCTSSLLSIILILAHG